MAAALAQPRFKGRAEFETAGIQPQSATDAHMAIATLRDYFGFSIIDHVPRSVDSVDLESYLHVVAMDDDVAEELRGRTRRQIIAWNVSDPWDGDVESYVACARRIAEQIETFSIDTPAG